MKIGFIVNSLPMAILIFCAPIGDASNFSASAGSGNHTVVSCHRPATGGMLLAQAKPFEGEPIIKPKKKIEQTQTHQMDFEKNIGDLSVSIGEKMRILDLLSGYVRFANRKNIQKLNYIDENIMKRMGELGFDFGYVLGNSARVEYVSKMFSLLGQSAAEKETQRTGSPQIEWEDWYELIAVEAEAHKETLAK